MATITGTSSSVVGGVSKFTFTPMTFSGLDVTADVLEAPDFAHKEVQVTGTFGAGGSVSVEGSLDGGTTWATLNDVQGNALTFTAARIEKIQETISRIRARVTAGDGTTSLTIIFAFKSGGTYGS